MTEKVHIDDAELRELLQLVSHDLRNPLAAIVTNLEFAKRLLARISVDPDLAESVDDSVTACDVLRRIVANFDVIVKGRDVSVTIQELDIGATLADVSKRCLDRASQSGIEIALVGVDQGTRALLDRSLFALATENLLSNSIQYGPRRSTITIELATHDDHALVTISDDGPPVPEELREIAVDAKGHTPAGRVDGMRYGRGLGLLAARAASAACGCTLTLGGDKTSVLSLKIPLLPTG